MNYLGCLLLLLFGAAVGLSWQSDPFCSTLLAAKVYYHWYQHYC